MQAEKQSRKPGSESNTLLSGFVLRRIHKLHRAIEELIEAAICDAVRIGPCHPLPGGGFKMEWHVRWWNPASWVAWSRTVIFRDRCGSAYYRRESR